LRDSHVLTQLLQERTTNVEGEPILLDTTTAVQHVHSTADELRERKQRTDELCDVRRLKLQQVLQLRTCERDITQVTNHIRIAVFVVVVIVVVVAMLI